MIKLFFRLLIFLLPFTGFSQVKDSIPYRYKSYLMGVVDSMPHITLREVFIYPSQKDWSRRQQRQYTSLERKVRKVYPMAKVAAQRVAEYNRIYVSFHTNKERREYVRQVEKELFKEFEGEIRSMSISEGKILIKLIDRETGHSSFEIIKEFKGGFAAFFWQTIAKIFGHDLKSSYDAKNEDSMIKYIVMQIDMGMFQ